jgi:hypothetical protein
VPDGEVEPPLWFNRYADTGLEYYTVNREHYTTMVVLAGIPERNGLQTWAAKGSQPLITPDRGGITSTVRGFGLDLASRDIGDEGWSSQNDASPGAAIPSLTAGSPGIASAYLFSPSATVVVHLTEPGRTEAILAANPRLTGGYQLVEGHVTTEHADGAVHVWGRAPGIADDGARIVIERSDGLTAYAFAVDGFRARSVDVVDGIVSLSWTDGSGAYEARINLTDGTCDGLRRGAVRVDRATP